MNPSDRSILHLPLIARLLIAAAAVVVLAAAALAPARAQPAAESQSTYSQQKPIIDGFSVTADNLAKRIGLSAQDDAQLVATRAELEQLSRDLLAASIAFRPRLAEINTRIDQLGPPPGAGMPPEPELITEERAALVKEKAEINTLIGVAETLSIRVNRMVEEIGTIRRDLFTSTLSKRYDVVAALSLTVWQELREEMSDLYRTVSAWMTFVTRFKLQSLLFANLFALLAATILYVGARRVFGRMIEPGDTVSQPSYLSRLSAAFWLTLLPSATVMVFLAVTYGLFTYFQILRPDIARILSALFQTIAIVFFVHRLSEAALSPRRPNWRLFPVDTPTARRLSWLASLTVVTTGIDFIMNKVNQVLGSPLSLTIAKSLIATVIVGLLLVLIGLVKLVRDGEDRKAVRYSLLNYVFLILGASTVIAALLGYIGFARFLSQQIVVTGAIASTMYLGFLTASAIADEGAFMTSAPGRYLQRRFNIDDTALDQLGLVASIATSILVIAIGIPLVLLQWGFQWGDITTWAYRLANQITIGSVSFSLVGILTGILVFVVGYFVTRGFQGWLDGSVMARGKVDAGVRNSIRSGVGYAGIALAGLLGVSAAGINLSSIALVAGALSLGIGFGLQNVVSNFVSGLILLAERPFKAGDWIVAGPVTGIVKRINVRATEIETFQRQIVTVPNSELINSAVGNWTHRNRLGRIEIRVGVAYGTDARRVHDILLGIARAHPMVLKNPEPFVQFSNFGPTALEFEIRLFLSDILSGSTVQNDVRFAIFDAFTAEGIEIPSAPRAVDARPPEKWQADDDKAEAELMELKAAEKARAEARPKGRRRRRGPDPD